MLNLSAITAEYPESLRIYKSFILREYLQYKILEALFESSMASRFCFLGGTCLRIVHDNQRFSEDLDFDNFALTEEAFSQASEWIKKALELQGFQVEIKLVVKGAYHCYIRFPGLLYDQGLSGYREEKILIQLDTEPQNFTFSPDIFYLNKFGVFTSIYTTPLDLLLAQKLTAICSRSRNKGRDFYDVVFLLSKAVKPNYEYLKTRLDINTPTQLRERIIEVCSQISLAEMANDVAPFLFQPSEEKKVRLFDKLWQQAAL